MRLIWYGHSAFRLEFAGTALLIDPFLSGNPTWGGGWEGASGRHLPRPPHPRP